MLALPIARPDVAEGAPACARAAALHHRGPRPAPRRLHVRSARLEDGAALSVDLRPADRAELAALGQAPREALAQAVALSAAPYAVVDAEGGLVALFGAAPLQGEGGCGEGAVGAPWMMASPRLERVARPFLRACRGWTDHIGRPFALLVNRVDARNAVHIRWLRWSGFTFLRPVTLGPERRPFLEFARLRASEAEPS